MPRPGGFCRACTGLIGWRWSFRQGRNGLQKISCVGSPSARRPLRGDRDGGLGLWRRCRLRGRRVVGCRWRKALVPRGNVRLRWGGGNGDRWSWLGCGGGRTVTVDDAPLHRQRGCAASPDWLKLRPRSAIRTVRAAFDAFWARLHGQHRISASWTADVLWEDGHRTLNHKRSIVLAKPKRDRGPLWRYGAVTIGSQLRRRAG